MLTTRKNPIRRDCRSRYSSITCRILITAGEPFICTQLQVVQRACDLSRIRMYNNSLTI